MKPEPRFYKGLVVGTVLSIPLWAGLIWIVCKLTSA